MTNLTESNIHDDKQVVIEGELRCQALKEHLKRSNAPMTVFLSEDASGLVQKVVYDRKNNQLTGIVLPLKANGMPTSFSFSPSTAEELSEFMKLSQSNLVYIVVAQPLASNSPSFILQIFGTNNVFKKEDVLKRWVQTEKELARY